MTNHMTVAASHTRYGFIDVEQCVVKSDRRDLRGSQCAKRRGISCCETGRRRRTPRQEGAAAGRGGSSLGHRRRGDIQSLCASTAEGSHARIAAEVVDVSQVVVIDVINGDDAQQQCLSTLHRLRFDDVHTVIPLVPNLTLATLREGCAPVPLQLCAPSRLIRCLPHRSAPSIHVARRQCFGRGRRGRRCRRERRRRRKRRRRWRRRQLKNVDYGGGVGRARAAG